MRFDYAIAIMRGKSVLIILASIAFFFGCEEKGSEEAVTKPKIIVVDRYAAEATYPVAMRNAPNIKAKKVKCTQWATEDNEGVQSGKNGWTCNDSCERESSYVPKGIVFSIEAKTEKKVKVKKWKNYWYKIDNTGFNCPENTEIWVFGEFVKKSDGDYH